MELLSPAGEYEAFLGAINARCDAVYLAGERFGARAYAQNFTDDEIIRAIDYAHLFGVKVYLTVNTLIKESEWQDVIDYVRKLYDAGLDGCIVQDLGLISSFSELFPNMECHISTQGFATGRFSARFYKSFGASRVVLARELSLDEISSVRENEGVEVEAFIHGAMCYAYSGNCLFSSCLGGRSGNRGRCAGPCRLEYRVISDGRVSDKGYFLSMKDQCALKLIPKLSDRNIDSLKIEGRMKKPEYAAFVTKTYRKYIDKYENDHDNYAVSEEDLNDLKHMYLRSKIGEGYFYKNNGKDMITVDSPSYNGNDEALMEKVRTDLIRNIRRIPVEGKVRVISEAKPELTLINGSTAVTVSLDDPVSFANNRAVSCDDIKKQISKMGDSPFVLNSIDVETDDRTFMPVSLLNELRRKAVAKLTEELKQKYLDERRIKKVSGSVFPDTQRPSFAVRPIVSVLTADQLSVLVSKRTDCYIAISPRLLLDESAGIDGMMADNVFLLELPLVMRDRDEQKVRTVIEKAVSLDFKGVICHNTEELGLVTSLGAGISVISGPGIYAWNKASVLAIRHFCDAMYAPLELSGNELKALNTEMYISVYGRMPLMNSANCLEKTAFSCKKEEGPGFLSLKDRKGVSFPVLRNCDFCFNTIYNSVPTSLLEEVNEGKIDRKYMSLSFTTEDKNMTGQVMDAFFWGKALPSGDYTRAYRRRGVE